MTDSPAFTLYPGETLAVLQRLPSASVDAIITDPPYSSGGMYRGDRTLEPGTKYVQSGTATSRPDFAGDNRDGRSWAYWCVLWLSECLRVAKPGSPIVIFSDWRQLATATDVLQAGGWVFRGIAGWDKTEGARPSYGRFRQQLEFIVWGSAGAMRSTGKPISGLFRFPVKQSDKFHTTGKPTPLMAALMDIVDLGGVVLDPFAGSSTTGVAALESGRRFIGIEKVPEYLILSRTRLEGARLSLDLPESPSPIAPPADLFDAGDVGDIGDTEEPPA